MKPQQYLEVYFAGIAKGVALAAPERFHQIFRAYFESDVRGEVGYRRECERLANVFAGTDHPLAGYKPDLTAEEIAKIVMAPGNAA